jgi:hypothetical protein
MPQSPAPLKSPLNSNGERAEEKQSWKVEPSPQTEKEDKISHMAQEVNVQSWDGCCPDPMTQISVVICEPCLLSHGPWSHTDTHCHGGWTQSTGGLWGLWGQSTGPPLCYPHLLFDVCGGWTTSPSFPWIYPPTSVLNVEMVCCLKVVWGCEVDGRAMGLVHRILGPAVWCLVEKNIKLCFVCPSPIYKRDSCCVQMP